MNNESVRDTLITGIKKNRFLYLDYGRYGLIVEPPKESDINYEAKELCFFISVPESSDLKNEDGEEMSGETLAKAYADKVRARYVEDVYNLQVATNVRPYKNLIEKSVKESVKIKYTTRDEHWTREKEEKATIIIMSALIAKENNV